MLAADWVLEPGSPDFHAEPLQLWAFISSALTSVSFNSCVWALGPEGCSLCLARPGGPRALGGTSLLRVSLLPLPWLTSEGRFQGQHPDLLSMSDSHLQPGSFNNW